MFDGATMLGFSAVHYKPTAEIVHRVHAAGAVRPTHRRQGLGTKLMQHGLATAEALHTLHHLTLHLVVESIYGEHVTGAVALYRAAGMTATRWARHMKHPLGTAIPDAPITEGLRTEGYTPETALVTAATLMPGPMRVWAISLGVPAIVVVNILFWVRLAAAGLSVARWLRR